LAIAFADRALSEFIQKLQFTNLISLAIRELLIAFRDTIKVYRSLYLKRNILHKNVSKNNIIITNSNEIDSFTEMLIDLDLAKVLDSERNNAQH